MKHSALVAHQPQMHDLGRSLACDQYNHQSACLQVSVSGLDLLAARRSLVALASARELSAAD